MILPAQDAVAGALRLMVADDGADDGHGVVGEELRACVHHLVLAELLDDLRNGGVNGAALLAEGTFALETAVCFGDDSKSHFILPFPARRRARSVFASVRRRDQVIGAGLKMQR